MRVGERDHERVGLRVLPERVKRLGVRDQLGGLGVGVVVRVVLGSFDLVGGLAVGLAVGLNVVVGLQDMVRVLLKVWVPEPLTLTVTLKDAVQDLEGVAVAVPGVLVVAVGRDSEAVIDPDVVRFSDAERVGVQVLVPVSSGVGLPVRVELGVRVPRLREQVRVGLLLSLRPDGLVDSVLLRVLVTLRLGVSVTVPELCTDRVRLLVGVDVGVQDLEGPVRVFDEGADPVGEKLPEWVQDRVKASE